MHLAIQILEMLYSVQLIQGCMGCILVSVPRRGAGRRSEKQVRGSRQHRAGFTPGSRCGGWKQGRQKGHCLTNDQGLFSCIVVRRC